MRFLIVATLLIFSSQVFAVGETATGEFEVELNGVKRIQVSVFGLETVKVAYAKNIDAAKVAISAIGESAGQAQSLLGVDVSAANGEVKISRFGNYSCEIRKKNGKVTFIEGACYQRAILTLPKGAKVEVYNLGKRLTKVFYAVTVEELTAAVDEASFDEGRMAAVDAFLASHKVVKQTPALTSAQLEQVIGFFSFSDNKLGAFKKIQKAVTDRENLGAAIDRIWSAPWDREEARKIAGLN